MSARTAPSPSKGKRPAPKPRAAPPATPVKPRAAAETRAPRARKAAAVAPDQRRRLIAEAAYFRAERRRFAPGEDLADWLEAEAEIDALLNARATA